MQHAGKKSNGGSKMHYHEVTPIKTMCSYHLGQGNIVQRKQCDMHKKYNKLFDYQLELLRSNPGTTVAVCLDPTIMEQNIF
jgi:hypothetical protein